MTVSKKSWHYKLVGNSLQEKDNQTINYIIQVLITIFISYLICPALLVLLIVIKLLNFLSEYKIFWDCLILFVSMPIWLIIFLLIIYPFITSNYKQLKITK